MRIYYILLALFTLISCGVKTAPDGIDLRDYFWKISDYEKPKVIVYEFDSLGVVSYNYYLIEKTNSDKLFLTSFDKSFNEVLFLEDTYDEKGVYLTKSSFVEDRINNIVTEIDIHRGFIFSFNEYEELGGNFSFELQLSKGIKVRSRDSWRFNEMTKKKIGDADINTIVFKGVSERIISDSNTGQEYNIDIQIENWYSENIGLTYTKQTLPNGSLTEKFVEIITLDEFNKMRVFKQ